MGVRASQDVEVQHPGQLQVIDEAAAPAHQTRILEARQARADRSGGRPGAHVPSRTRSQAQRIASTMF